MIEPREKPPSIERFVRASQLIKVGLVSGVITFGGYVLAVRPRPQEGDPMPLVWIAAGFAAAIAVARLFVPSLISRAMIRRVAEGTWPGGASGTPAPTSDAEKLAAVYQVQLLVGSALIEAAAFCNLFVCLVTDHVISWIVSAGALVALLIDFPTMPGVERWVAGKLDWVRDERRLSGPPTNADRLP